MYLGLHYSLDVLVGIGIGLANLFLFLYLKRSADQ
jgi:membrane-associated phospholipid phosphatase